MIHRNDMRSTFQHPLDASSGTWPLGLFMYCNRGCAVFAAEMFSLWLFLKSVLMTSEWGRTLLLRSWGIHDQVRKRESGRWSVMVSWSQQVPTRESVHFQEFFECIHLLRPPQQSTPEWMACTEMLAFSQFWRLEVQDEILGRFGFSWDLSP